MSDFDDIARLLREQRPELSELELDQVKQRALRRADRTSRKGQSMRSRFAILVMLVAGMLFSATGAGLAIQGSTGNGNAAQEQYPRETPGGVLGDEDESTPGEESDGEAAGEEDSSTTPAQPER